MRWAVVQLRERAEPLPVSTLYVLVRKVVPGVEIRCPAADHGVLAVDHPMANYAFIEGTGITTSHVLRLERAKDIERVLCVPGTKRPHLLTDRELAAMRTERMPTFCPGQRVTVTAGDFLGLEGDVVTTTPDGVIVEMRLWSGIRQVAIDPKQLT